MVARLAGLEDGDLLIAADGAPITGIDAVQRLLNAEHIGRPTLMRVIRRGRQIDFSVTPKESD